MFLNGLTFEEWYLTRFRPLMGGEDDDDSSADAGGTGDDDTDAGAGGDNADDDAAASGGDDSSDDDDSSSSSDDDDSGDGTVARLEARLQKAQQDLQAAQAAARREKDKARAASRKAAEDSGNWEHVARERESELADANERATNAERERDTVRDELDQFRREVRVTRIASSLSFRDPGDAMALLEKQGEFEATGDDKSADRALRKLAEKKPYLVDQRRASGRGMQGGGSGGNGATLTREQMETMTPEQINAHWDKVSQGLASLGRT